MYFFFFLSFFFSTKMHYEYKGTFFFFFFFSEIGLKVLISRFTPCLLLQQAWINLDERKRREEEKVNHVFFHNRLLRKPPYTSTKKEDGKACTAWTSRWTWFSWLWQWLRIKGRHFKDFKEFRRIKWICIFSWFCFNRTNFMEYLNEPYWTLTWCLS